MSKNLYCMKSLIQNIKSNFKKNIFKKIFWVLILLWIWTAVFSQGNVYAQVDNVGWTDQTKSESAEQQQVDKLIDINEILDFWLKLIYALLWPVLFIAWWALDNSWVYGSFLHLDASLWSLWNIMKNFANFALWFFVLYAIVKNIFYAFKDNNDEWSPLSVIKKTLIAGVLIQMSWFLMAVMIDLSTILTYSIGGLPMTVLQNNPVYKELPILWVNASLNSNNGSWETMGLDFYSTYDDKNLAQCKISKMPGFSWQFIVGREKINLSSWEVFEKWLCSLAAWPYKYNDLWSGYDNTDNISYQYVINTKIKEALTGTVQWWIDECRVIPMDVSKRPESCDWFWLMSKDDKFFTEADSKITLNSLLKESKWFVWPFITIYSSILDFSSLASSPDSENSLTSNTFKFLIKFLFAVALFFPLLVLAIVLIARIWMLWLAIVLSPILALLNVFSKAFWSDPVKKISESFTLPNLIKLIFAPVFVVFAISMSLIFLTALDPIADNANEKLDRELEQMQALGIEMEGTKVSILWLVDLDLGNDWLSTINKGKNTFSWLITNLFAVGIVWFFVFMAVRMTTIGESIWKNMQEWIETMLKNIPIVPVPWGGMVWLKTAQYGFDQWSKNINSKITQAQQKTLKDSMPMIFGDGHEDDANKASIWDRQSAWANYELAKSLIAWGATKAEAFEQAKFTENQQAIVNNYDSKYIDNITNVTSNYNADWWIGKYEKPKDWYTNADAQKHSISDLNSAIKWDEDRKKWAGSMLWWAVHTLDWVYIMDNNGSASQPIYNLVTQDAYEKKHFGSSFSEVTETKLENMSKQEKDDYEKYEKGIARMKKDNETLQKNIDGWKTLEEVDEKRKGYIETYLKSITPDNTKPKPKTETETETKTDTKTDTDTDTQNTQNTP